VVVAKDEGWWNGRLPSGASGIFPENYVEELSAEDNGDDDAKSVKSVAKSVKSVAKSAKSAKSSKSSVKPAADAPVLCRVRALFDYTADDTDELSFKAGDVFDVVAKDEGWWNGRLASGASGIFPENYVEQVPTEDNGDDDAKSVKSVARSTKSAKSAKSSVKPAADAPVLCRVRALFDYTADDTDELSFKAGDVFDVVAKDEGWWNGRLASGASGIFPENYVEEISADADGGGGGGDSAVLCRARALFAYEAADTDELSFAVGDMIDVTEKDEGWWTGSVNGGASGTFPENYVETV
jgi:hypothetical protein